MKRFMVDIRHRDLADLSVLVFIGGAFSLLVSLFLVAVFTVPFKPDDDYIFSGAFILWGLFWCRVLWSFRKIMLQWEGSQFNCRVFLLIPIIVLLLNIPHLISEGLQDWSERVMLLIIFEIIIVGLYLTSFLLLAIIPRWPKWSDLLGFSIILLSLASAY